ncbi:MAG: hypothetical protein EHM23_27855 [Acidobacteria bacterium]|nr:MAG: hypothetical protein EHM23_27855 [Acidobacteriota bacterium]
MQLNFTKMSLDANPPLGIEPQERTGKHDRSEQWGGRPFMLQTNSIQCLGSAIQNVQRSPHAFLFWCAALGALRPSVQFSPANSVIDQFQASAGRPTRSSEGKSIWRVLESLIGTVDAPPDWAAEHDHYLYGTPKRGDD